MKSLYLGPDGRGTPAVVVSAEHMAERQRLYEEVTEATLLVQEHQQAKDLRQKEAWAHLLEMVTVVEPLCDLITRLDLKIGHGDYARVRRNVSEGGVDVGSIHVARGNSTETIQQAVRMILKVPGAVRTVLSKDKAI